MRGSGSRVLVAVVALAGVLIGGVGPVRPPGAPADKVLTAPPELARFNDLRADLPERLKPAIVHVRVRREAPTSTDDSQEPQERRASGSGFLIDPEGVIVTNAHVVEDVTTAQVRLFDGRRFTGKVIGRDSRVDLALLKLDGVKGLPTLALADSNRVRVGEFVLALGHPFGLEHTVSFGIVSRKGAPLTVAAPGFDFIQTDAAINPGNSGGPLVNMAGQVIGVNSMAARNGSIGFAIPSNLAKTLVPQPVASGKGEWGWLGVSIGAGARRGQRRQRGPGPGLLERGRRRVRDGGGDPHAALPLGRRILEDLLDGQQEVPELERLSAGDGQRPVHRAALHVDGHVGLH